MLGYSMHLSSDHCDSKCILPASNLQPCLLLKEGKRGPHNACTQLCLDDGLLYLACGLAHARAQASPVHYRTQILTERAERLPTGFDEGLQLRRSVRCITYWLGAPSCTILPTQDQQQCPYMSCTSALS